jgi:hypothetical protein
MSGVRKLLVALAIVGLVIYGGHRDTILEAAPVVTDWCANVCDDEVSCTEPCLFAPPELPAIEITCGEYDGGPSNDWCDGDGCADECSWWSEPSDVCWWQDQETDCETYGEFGECDDGICVGWQGETCTTCEEDCGVCPVPPVCGDDECDYGETWRSCPQDCDEPTGPEDCGDGVCSEAVRTKTATRVLTIVRSPVTGAAASRNVPTAGNASTTCACGRPTRSTSAARVRATESTCASMAPRSATWARYVPGVVGPTLASACPVGGFNSQ